jgi:hypothetical protein
MGEWRHTYTILALGSRLRWVVSFTSLPLYPQENSLRYPLDTRLGGAQSRSGRYGEKKNLSPCRESNLGRSPLLYQLSYPGCIIPFAFGIHILTLQNLISQYDHTRYLRGFLLTSFCFLNLADRNDTFLRNVGWLSVDYTMLYPRKEKC